MRSTLLLAGLAACGSSPPKTRVIAPAMLTVQDAGAEPRRPLRREIPLHTKEREQAQVNTTIERTVENAVRETGSARVQMPTITLVGDTEVTAVDPDGTMTIHYETERATYAGDVADPKALRAIEAEVAALRNLKITYRLSPQNVPRYDNTSQMADLLSQGTVRFPDEPVGVGAAWTVTSKVSLAGVEWERRTTYHLKALDDASASIEIDLDATAPKQTLAQDSHGAVVVSGGHETGHALYMIPLHAIVTTGSGRDVDDIAMQMVRNDHRVRASSHTEEELAVKPADDATR